MGGGQEKLGVVSEKAADSKSAAATTWRLTIGELSILVSRQFLLTEMSLSFIGLVV
jgi:hypothetical protein